jgi:hypothetical protein
LKGTPPSAIVQYMKPSDCEIFISASHAMDL